MMKKITIILTALMIIVSALPTACFGDALAPEDIEIQTDFYVMVSADDGGVNFREGPGTEYSKLIDDMIPNGMILHISRMRSANDGIAWGYTEYAGMEGWIALTEVTEIDPEIDPFAGGGDDPDPPGSNWHELVFPDDITTFYFAEVVAPDGTEMYIGPGEDYELAFEGVVPEGTELFITGEQEGTDGSMWGFALYGETMGWIRVEDVEELDLPGMDLIDPDGHSQGGSSSGTYEKIKLRKTVSQTDGGNEADALPWAVPLLIAAIVVLIASSIALAVVIGKNRRN